MANLNKVFLIGHITRDPELRYTPSGTAIASFGIAVNRNWKGQDGEKKEEVCFVEIVMFGARGEAVSNYLHKGDPIFIEGRLQLQQWDDKSGQKRSMLKVVGESFQFIGSSKASKSERPNQEDTDINDEDIPY